MDTSRRAVESYWRSKMIDAATSDEDKVTAVYKLNEICDLLHSSHVSIIKEVSDFIFKRLQHKSPIVKQKKKTVSGKIVSTKPVSLSKAANVLSNFVTSDNGASQLVAAYLRCASAAFNELVYFKKHQNLHKSSSKYEASTKSNTSHRSLEECEVKDVENGGSKKKFDQDSAEVDEHRTSKVEGKLRKKEKKRKKSEGSLGNKENANIKVEFNEDNEIMNEKSEEKKKKKKRKNAEVDGGETGNSLTSERKNRRKTEADD